MADNIEKVVSQDPRIVWTQAVWDACRSKCSNCGGTDKLRVKMIVPEESGGKLIPSNGCLLCRACEMASESAPPSGAALRPINFWVSDKLYKALQSNARGGFHSMAALVRYMMAKYVSDADRFDDLQKYQDEGSDVKVNVWVETDRYANFKLLVDSRGLTVTDAIKALIRMYEAESAPLVRKEG